MPGSSMLLVFAILLVVLPSRVAAFGAGNIPSIAQVEGHNWRHGGVYCSSRVAVRCASY